MRSWLLLILLLLACQEPTASLARRWSTPVFDSTVFWEWQTTDGDVLVGMLPDSAIGWRRGRTQLLGPVPQEARRLLERAQAETPRVP